MSPKRRKVEAALQNLFSGKSSQDKEEPVDAVQPESAEEIQPETPKPETEQPAPKPRTQRRTNRAKKTEEQAEQEPTKSIPEKAAPPQAAEKKTTATPKPAAPEPPKTEPLKKTAEPEKTEEPKPEKPVKTEPKEQKPVEQKPVEKTSAPVEEETKQVSDEKQLVVFTLNQEYFGVEIALVESIIKMQHFTVVPHTPEYIVGVTNLRGYVLPVVDLRTRFNYDTQEETVETRIMVLLINGEKVGMIVDGVSEVASVSAKDIDPTPAMVTNINMDFVSGIAKLRNEERDEERMAILLDMVKVLKIK